jgi:hypothetical protein
MDAQIRLSTDILGVAVISGFGSKSWLVGLPDISNNVGPVKSFLSALPRSLLRVVFLVLS